MPGISEGVSVFMETNLREVSIALLLPGGLYSRDYELPAGSWKE